MALATRGTRGTCTRCAHGLARPCILPAPPSRASEAVSLAASIMRRIYPAPGTRISRVHGRGTRAGAAGFGCCDAVSLSGGCSRRAPSWRPAVLPSAPTGGAEDLYLVEAQAGLEHAHVEGHAVAVQVRLRGQGATSLSCASCACKTARVAVAVQVRLPHPDRLDVRERQGDRDILLVS